MINPVRQVSGTMTGLILSPVLNFIYRSMTEGAKIELIVGKTTSFFSKDDIITAKEILNDKFQFTSRFVRNVKCEDNVTEICKWLHARDKEKKPMPKFVIENPCSVPTLGDAVVATLAVKVNELGRKIDYLVESNNNKSISTPSKFNIGIRGSILCSCTQELTWITQHPQCS